MEIHKPKAVHGWRELANEIGVIVIGVLIALSAEQTVEALHWHDQVEHGEDALREDARELIDSAAEREAQSPCIARRFTAIAEILDTASASGRLPPVGQLGSPSKRTWSFSAWNTLVASQVPMRMPRKKMLVYSGIATTAARLAELNDEEREAWTTLYTIVGPGRLFGSAEQAATRAALSHAVLAAKEELAYSEDIRLSIEDVVLTKSEVRDIRQKAADQYRIDAREGIMCKPLADAPRAAIYGQAPSRIDLSAPFKP